MCYNSRDMAALLVISPEPLVGKTAVAVGLAQRLRAQGRSVALLRLRGDEHANHDAALFTSLPFNARRGGGPVDGAAAKAAAGETDAAVIEAPAGEPSAHLAALGGRAVAVARYRPDGLDALAGFCQPLGESLAGVVLTCVPARRAERVGQELEGRRLPLLALVPEDRTLAAPTLAQVAQALEAEATFLEGNGQRVVDRPVIASISADPGQSYFAYCQPSAVIVRSDKPDLQLAALNAGAPCLIVTGGLPILSYVLDRAESEEVPILRTRLDTIAAVRRLEELYAAVPFAGEGKIDRIGQLLGSLELPRL